MMYIINFILYFFYRNIYIYKWKDFSDSRQIRSIFYNSRRFEGRVLFIVDTDNEISPSPANHEKCRGIHSNTDPAAATMRDDFLRDEISLNPLLPSHVYSSFIPSRSYRHGRTSFTNPVSFQDVNEVITRATRNLGHFLPPEMRVKNAKSLTFSYEQTKETAGTVKFFLVYRFCSRSKRFVFFSKYSSK